ncbi:hypothetical protein [Cellvibrio sp. UBA7671]|uniref:hypothetical protein n=1 Tax=Cellvibrio sp. UBA7671 TaxID=1946312 RepID=UPI002F352AEB
MFSSKIVYGSFFLLSLSGCASVECVKKTTEEVLPGTSTALVGLYIDRNGYPQASVETVVVAPGQRIIFVGPEKFDIIFKNEKSPVEQFKLSARDGVLILDIPRDVFAQEDKDDRTNIGKDEISYKYGIKANGKETDPEIKVRPR